MGDDNVIGTRKSSRKNEGASSNRDETTSRRTTGDKGGANIQATTISFTTTATIADSGNGLGVFAVGDIVEVKGSALNSRQFRLTAVAAGSVTVVPALVRTESAGALVLIRKVA